MKHDAATGLKELANLGYLVTIQAFGWPTRYQVNAIPVGAGPDERCFSAVGTLRAATSKLMAAIKAEVL